VAIRVSIRLAADGLKREGTEERTIAIGRDKKRRFQEGERQARFGQQDAHPKGGGVTKRDFACQALPVVTSEGFHEKGGGGMD